jgi:hypothetical protein
MGLFDAFKNKSGKSQKTSYSCGNKYITETKRTKTGSVTTTKPVKRNTKPRSK